MKNARMMIFVAAVCWGAAAGRADMWTGSGGNDNWGTAANWADNASPAGKAIRFSNADMTPVGTVNSIVDTSVTIGTLTMTNYSPSGQGHTIQINAGQTLTVTGAVTIAFDPGFNVRQATSTYVNVTGSGALVISNSVEIGNAGGSPATNIVDMSQLSRLTVTAPAGVIGVANVRNESRTTWKLAATNTLTAREIRFAYGSNSSPQSNRLELGKANVLNVNTIQVGVARQNGFFVFQSGLTAPTLVIRDTAGTGRANVNIGWSGNNPLNSTVIVGVMDLTGGTVDAKINDLLVGGRQGAAITTNSVVIGQFHMSGGTVDVVRAKVGWTDGGSATPGLASGTVAVAGGTFVADSIVLADDDAANHNSVVGVLALNGGTVRGGVIERGDGNGTAIFAWSSGTVGNKSGTDLTIAANLPLTLSSAAQHIFDIDAGRQGTVNSVITGGVGVGGVTKTGDGTLVYAGTNTYAGTTTVSAGTLQINTNFGAAGGMVLVDSGGTLGIGDGVSLGRDVTVNNGGTFSPGSSPGEVTVPNLTFNAGSIHLWEIDATTNDVVNVTGALNFNFSAPQTMTLGVAMLAGAPEVQLTDVFRVFTYTTLTGWDTGYGQANPSSLFAIQNYGNFDTSQAYVWADAAANGTLWLSGLQRAIPEPGTALMALFAAGLMTAAHRRRR